MLPRRKVSINLQSSGDIGASPKGSINKRNSLFKKKKEKKTTDILYQDEMRLTNVVGPFPRNPLEIKVSDRRWIYLKNKILLPPSIILIRNAFDDNTTTSRSKNHRAREAVVSLYGT